MLQASTPSRQARPATHNYARFISTRARARGFVRTSATASVGNSTPQQQVPASDPLNDLLACPVCFQPVQRGVGKNKAWTCTPCALSYPDKGTFAEMVLESNASVDGGAEQGRGTYAEQRILGTTTFERPQVSFAYERGWRQSFSWAGFPGADREYAMASEFLETTPSGPFLDLSCGSGLFTRRFASSGKWSPVVAADFSEAMLSETAERMRAESTSGVKLVRADARRLPFRSACFAAIHAGAAIHCWPQPELCVAEVARTLKPGGMFVGSTFLTPLSRLGQFLGDDSAVAPIEQLAGDQLWGGRGEYKFWTERELRDVCARAGLKDFRCTRDQQYIMFCAVKGDPTV